jgi:predicted RND superfamily exporter protein
MFYRITAFCNALTRRHLEWIFRLTTSRPLPVMCLFVLMLVISATVISSIRFDTDIFRLFPTRQPALKLLLDSLEWTGSAKDAYFLVEGDKQTLSAEAGRFAERLKQAKIDGQPAFKRVTWRVYDENQAAAFTEFISFAIAHPQLFIGPKDVQRFLERYTPDQSEAALHRLQSELAGQFGGGMTGLFTADPLYLRDFILPRLKAGSQSLDLDPASPYFISRNGNVLIIIAEPAKPVQDMVFARKLVTSINDARRGAPVSISCAGAHISAVLDEAAMKSNVLVSVASSLVVVLGIFFAAYRRLLPTLLIPLILVCGVVFALGTAGLFLSSIHIISFAFTALITGIGTDYSVHIYDRFHTERAAGSDTGEALRLALLDTGHGVFTAAITTGIPFLALMISDVRALFELGILVGLGVIYSFYATIIFLPPLLIFMDTRYPIIYRPIPGLGLSRIWRLAKLRPALIITISLAVIALLCWSGRNINFDGELKNLQPRHSEAFLANEKLEKNLSIAPKQLLVALEGKKLSDVLERVSRLDSVAEKMQERGEIIAWSSLTRLVNSQAVQTDVAKQLREYFDSGKRSEALRTQLDRQGFAQEPFRPFLDAVQGMAEAAPVKPEEMVARLLASPFKGVIDRHLIKDAAGYHALVYLHYGATGFDLAAFRKNLTAIDPAARLTGLDLVSSQLKETVRSSFTWSFLLGGVLVVFLLIVQFAESRSGIFYSLFPVAAAIGCMLGVMVLVDMGLNFMNAMVMVTIVGMGSDFGLYIRFRVSADTPEARENQYVQIGRSVLLSAMTTIVGFGSLAFTDYGAMSSIGWATNIGIGFITLFSLVTLPAVMFLKVSAKGKA